MSIEIGRYTFEGPYRSTGDLKDKPGVYAVICKKEDELYLLDINESKQVKSSIQNNKREECWRKYCNETLTVAVHYTHIQKKERKDMVKEIREHYGNIPCGKTPKQ